VRNQAAVITGTQRSGTTLLALILDSHPEMHMVDETYYSEVSLQRYLTGPKLAPRVVFKLPKIAPDIAWLRALPARHVLWSIRDPRDVVASMLQLTIPLGRTMAACWAIHPLGAPHDIAAVRGALDDRQRATLADALARYDGIYARPITDISFTEAVFTAALCWRVKNEMLQRYDAEGLSYQVVRYEALVTEPRREIATILRYLDAAWHDDVLRHHELHSGIYTAKTDFSRAIDRESIGRWNGYFRPHELEVIEGLTRPLAERFGYWRGSRAVA